MEGESGAGILGRRGGSAQSVGAALADGALSVRSALLRHLSWSCCPVLRAVSHAYHMIEVVAMSEADAGREQLDLYRVFRAKGHTK